MATKTYYIGSHGPFFFDDATETGENLVRTQDVGAAAGAGGGQTVAFQVVADMRNNAGTHEKKTRTLTFTNGILTNAGTESAWTPI